MAKVIVLLGDLKVTVAVPMAQEADVDWFVHEPPKAHASEPKETYDAAAEMFTFPVTVTVPDVLRSAPPPRVMFPLTVSVKVALVSEPLFRFNVDAMRPEVWLMVPAMVSVANVVAARSFTFFVAPAKVTTEVPGLKADPTPEVSQLPETVHDPLVSVIVPEVPPVIVTLTTDTVEVFAVSAPPLPTVRLPPVRARLDVARVEAAIVNVPPQFKAFVPIVKIGLPEAGWNVTLFVNSCVSAPNVIVWEVVELNVIGAAKDHEADVDAFVHEPPTVHVPAPDVT